MVPPARTADNVLSRFEPRPQTLVRQEMPSFDALYEAEFDFVWRSVRALGIPEHATDDVAQEIFIVVHRRLADFEGRSSVRTWVYGILRNVVRSHRRSIPAPSTVDPADLTDGGSAPDETAAQAEAARIVVRLLDALDDDKREVFVLAELEQMSVVEIAGMLGEKVNTIYSRLRLAREAFAAAAARYRQRDEWRLR